VIAPYDFEVLHSGSTVPRHVDVKATSGDFSRPIHISLSELRDMATSESQYDLYRLFSVGAEGAELKVCEDVRDTARQILSIFAGLPSHVMVDSIALQPESLPFSESIRLASEDMDNVLRPTGG
jgi:hypothetical protein